MSNLPQKPTLALTHDMFKYCFVHFDVLIQDPIVNYSCFTFSGGRGGGPSPEVEGKNAHELAIILSMNIV